MTTPKVCPSGAALAIWSTPMMLLAPGLFSTMTGWPRAFCRPTCSRRAIWSVKPPAVYGTMMRMGLEGQGLWAQAEGASTVVAAAAAAAVDCKKPRRGGGGIDRKSGGEG